MNQFAEGRGVNNMMNVSMLSDMPMDEI